ncbi:MAG: flagellar basal body protein FliL [Sulfurimonas sp.]|nr:MAG: flagellar basal body protein FliL [Sulfurimonas sp.]
MAEEETTPVEKKSSKMLMMIIIIVLFLIIIIGGIVTVLLMSDDEEMPTNNRQMQEMNTPKRNIFKGPSAQYNNSRQLRDIGILYPLDTFTVNLKSDAGRRYLKVTMSLELEGEELSLELDAKSPVIRDRIIRILTSKMLEEISSKKGKQKVSQQIIDVLNAMISDGTIRGIYFTEFIIQ